MTIRNMYDAAIEANYNIAYGNSFDLIYRDNILKNFVFDDTVYAVNVVGKPRPSLSYFTGWALSNGFPKWDTEHGTAPVSPGTGVTFFKREIL